MLKKILFTLTALLLFFIFSLSALALYYFFPRISFPKNAVADKVVIIKHKRKLYLKKDGKNLKTYKISLGREPKGQKTCQGDNKTPEGKFILDWKNPKSCCHLSIHVSYPRPEDKARAAKAGCSPGGSIMIHGISDRVGWIGRFHRFCDWTHGCIAVTNEEMDEIYRAVPGGTPIEIQP